MADERSVAGSVECMTALNNTAAELMAEVEVHACTDVTGFGLLGHACEMIEGEDVGMEIYPSKIPILPGTEDYAKMGLVPGGTIRNRDFRLSMIEGAAGITDERLLILFDAQTSGGLLISVPGPQAPVLIERLHHRGLKDAAIVGEVVDQPKGKVIIVNEE
jgi:selenide,water dikinase